MVASKGPKLYHVSLTQLSAYHLGGAAASAVGVVGAASSL